MIAPLPARKRRAIARPIIFTGRAVDSIRRGDKTQTRRVMREPAGFRANYIMQSEAPIVMCQPRAKPSAQREPGQTPEREIRCPYGVRGDLLWVKETWRAPLEHHPDLIVYRADLAEAELARQARASEPIVWRSPLLMPQRYARLWLRITRVRAQTLESISNADIRAEGLVCRVHAYRGCGLADCPTLREQFRSLWDGIHRQHPARQMSRNPVVWALNFEICSAPT